MSGSTDTHGLALSHAKGFVARLRGWLGRSRIAPDEALWLEPCHAVHGFGMRVAIDVVFLDRASRILKIARLAPWRVCRCAGARVVVEMADGAAGRLGLSVGQSWPGTVVADVDPIKEHRT